MPGGAVKGAEEEKGRVHQRPFPPLPWLVLLSHGCFSYDINSRQGSWRPIGPETHY